MSDSSHTVEEFSVENIDQRGHQMFGNPKFGVKEASFSVSRWTKENETDKVFISAITGFNCSYCNAYPKFKLVNGVPVSATVCTYNNAEPPTFTLSVPSGRIVFADSLFNIMGDIETDNDYNSAAGRAAYYKKCEAAGIAYGAVLNTSPTLFRHIITNQLFIANTGWDEQDEEIVPENWERLGSFITDLWAYSIVDADNYTAHGGNMETDLYIESVSIPAGDYVFTHYADQPDFDDEADDTVIFAKATFVPNQR